MLKEAKYFSFFVMKTSNLPTLKHIHSALPPVKVKARSLLPSKASLPGTLLPSHNSDPFDYLPF